MLNNIPKISRSFLEKSVIVGNPHLYWVGKDSDSAIVLYFDYITEVPETEDSHAIVEAIRYILKEGRYFACEYKKVIATSLCSQLEGIKKYTPFICATSLFEE